MEILSQEKFSDIITWLPHGRGFVILQKKRFANEIMPKYFNKKSKFTSFTRKLNRWYVSLLAYLLLVVYWKNATNCKRSSTRNSDDCPNLVKPCPI